MEFSRIPTIANGLPHSTFPKYEIDKGDPCEIIRHANAGNANCQNLLGKMHSNGVDVEQDDGLAIRYFNMAAEQGHPEAKENLAALFLAGRGINSDTKSQAEEFLRATMRGDSKDAPTAKYQMALLIADTQPAEALRLLKDAVEKNVPDALNQLANLLCRSGAIDSENANYLKQAADELKHEKAACAYAEYVSQSGSDGEKESLPYYKIAAEQGNKLAEFKYQEYSGAGTEDQVESDIRFGLKRFDINLGLVICSNRKLIAVDAYKFAKAYLYGDKELGILPDMKKAKRYLEFGAEAWHPISSYLYYGLKKEIWFLERAVIGNYLPAVLEDKADKGNVKAAFELYLLLRNGDEFLELQPNKEKATIYLDKAIKGRYTPALEENNKGLPKNHPRYIEFSPMNSTTKNMDLTPTEQRIFDKLKRKADIETQSTIVKTPTGTLALSDDGL